MALPSVSITKRDGALGLVVPGASKPLYIGPSSGGTQNTIVTVSQPGAVNTAIGYGPLATAVQMYLNDNGGSADIIVSAASTAATSGSFTSSFGGTTVLSGTPRDTYVCSASISTTGFLASSGSTARFIYSLDGGETYSAPQLVTASVSLANTGLTLTFANGIYTSGQALSFDTHSPVMTVSDLASAIAPALLTGETPSAIVVVNEPTTSAAAKLIATAMDAHLASFESKYVYTQAILSAGGEAETPLVTNTTWQAFDFSTGRVGGVCSRSARRTLPNPYTGYGAPHLNWSLHVAPHTLARDISSSPAAVIFGAVKGAYDPTYDEFQDGETFLPNRLMCPRTFIGRGGLYFNQSVTKVSVGSDFDSLEKGRVINRAAQIVQIGLTKYVNSNVRVKTDGTGQIDPRDADAIDADINAQLAAALFNVTNQFGTRGHCSGFKFAVDRTGDLLATGILESSCLIVPLGKITSLPVTLSFARQITTA
jgi:hypothetical protein